MTKKFIQWALTDATPTQKSSFLSVYSEQLNSGPTPDLNPDTPEKMALWESYCTATGQDSTLPNGGNEAPVIKEETPPA